MLNFNLSNQPTQSTNKPLLKPYGIYPVTLTSIESNSFAGKKDPSKTYKVMKVRFDAEDGYYTETIFFPESQKDMERAAWDNTDKDGKPYKSYTPSSYDRAMFFVAQLASAVNPEGWKTMQKASSNWTTFDEVVNALIEITKDSFGKFETNLKLLGRSRSGRIEPVLPNFVKISSKTQEPYFADNFIGKVLGFSPTEEAKRTAYLNAAPTNMPDNSKDVVEDIPDNPDSTIDLDDIDDL